MDKLKRKNHSFVVSVVHSVQFDPRLVYKTDLFACLIAFHGFQMSACPIEHRSLFLFVPFSIVFETFTTNKCTCCSQLSPNAQRVCFCLIIGYFLLYLSV